VFRWKHTAALNWRMGNWGATVSQSFKSGYTDQNNVAEHTRRAVVQPVERVGQLCVEGPAADGRREEPVRQGTAVLEPGTLFQKGYDPRYTDPVGRACTLRGSYTF
jgi:iron complex outermembrane receptor protein